MLEPTSIQSLRQMTALVDLTTSQTNSQDNTCDNSVPCLNEGLNQVTVAADATDSVVQHSHKPTRNQTHVQELVADVPTAWPM